MIRKLSMVAAVVLALTSSIGVGVAEAHGWGGHGGGGWHPGWGYHHFGGPGYYGYTPYCYVTVYGTTACY